MFCSKACKTLDQWGQTPESRLRPTQRHVCANCGDSTARLRRVLCCKCWRDPAVRARFPARPRGRKPGQDYRWCVCRCCKEKKVEQALGLCFTCWKQPDLRHTFGVRLVLRRTRGEPVFSSEERNKLILSRPGIFWKVVWQLWWRYKGCRRLGTPQRLFELAQGEVLLAFADYDAETAAKVNPYVYMTCQARWRVLNCLRQLGREKQLTEAEAAAV